LIYGVKSFYFEKNQILTFDHFLDHPYIKSIILRNDACKLRNVNAAMMENQNSQIDHNQSSEYTEINENFHIMNRDLQAKNDSYFYSMRIAKTHLSAQTDAFEKIRKAMLEAK
jgi:16S rRNA G966 N2-methylase RsmD